MQPENGTVPVRKDDLDVLVAACTSYLPADASPEVTEAFGRVLKSFDEVHGIAEDVPGRPPPGDGPALGDGQFMAISFMGHAEMRRMPPAGDPRSWIVPGSTTPVGRHGRAGGREGG